MEARKARPRSIEPPQERCMSSFASYPGIVGAWAPKAPTEASKVDSLEPRALCFWVAGQGPKPSTLNPQPSTLNPQPSTLNPQPSTPNPWQAGAGRHEKARHGGQGDGGHREGCPLLRSRLLLPRSPASSPVSGIDGVFSNVRSAAQVGAYRGTSLTRKRTPPRTLP